MVSSLKDPMAGIVPRALGQLFDELRRQSAEFTIRVSFLELYNEELYDLLAPVEGQKLKYDCKPDVCVPLKALT